MKYSRVEICGGIASGKTTLARLLGQVPLSPVLEDFRRNPFLTDFYADQVRFAFETELSFVLQHYHAVVKAHIGGRAVCDFSFDLDLAYANYTLGQQDLRHFRYLHGVLVSRLRAPSLLIRLECPSKVELDRIRSRRRARESAITIQYLDGLDLALTRVIGSLKSMRILAINSDALDFAHNPKHRQYVLSRVRSFMRASNSRGRLDGSGAD